MIRVIVADDHHLVRQGIRSLLEQASDIEVIGEAGDGLEAIELAQRLKPDVIVMDIVMPYLNGTQAAERLRQLPHPPRVILLSMYSDPTLIQQALKSGVRGYLLKRCVVEELLLAVRAAARGEIYLSPTISTMLVNGDAGVTSQPSGNPSLQRLTPREVEVLKLIADGKTSARIGQLLGISEKTVEKHRSSLMEKLDIHDIAGLVRFAIKNQLVELDDGY
jgi:DNA-binding NarL/FixJ family response regulator